MQARMVTALILMASAAPALAQPAVPAANGNRANGLNYQPTPGQVAPREKAAGVAPSRTQRQQTDQALWNRDARLLKSQGLSTKSVPGHGAGNQH